MNPEVTLPVTFPNLATPTNSEPFDSGLLFMMSASTTEPSL
jgi:hypothetical protein